MKGLVAVTLYALWVVFWLASWPFLAVAQIAISAAKPFRWAAGRFLAKAREWDPRLAARGQHADLHPPP